MDKKLIGERIKEHRIKYIGKYRKNIMDSNTELTINKLINIESGRTLIDIKTLIWLSSITNNSIYYYITGKEISFCLKLDDASILIGMNDKQVIDLLIRGICYVCSDNGNLYKKELIENMDSIDYFDKFVGYMLELIIRLNDVDELKLCSFLNIDIKTLERIKKGNVKLANAKWYYLSEYLDVPLDVFMIGVINKKKPVEDYLLSILIKKDKKVIEYLKKCKEKLMEYN